jgi:CRISPR-associated protein Csd1
VAVFANLMRLHQHHLNKLIKEKPGMDVNYRKLIGEIQDKIRIINNGAIAYPTHLSLIQQGLFAVGYYQQRQDFFKTKEEKIEPENKI